MNSAFLVFGLVGGNAGFERDAEIGQKASKKLKAGNNLRILPSFSPAIFAGFSSAKRMAESGPMHETPANNRALPLSEIAIAP
jgi:hypothetical protein